MVSDVTMAYHPRCAPRPPGTSLGVTLADWIEAASSEGKVRIVRTEAADPRGQRPPQISYATNTDDFHFLMILLVRFG